MKTFFGLSSFLTIFIATILFFSAFSVASAGFCTGICPSGYSQASGAGHCVPGRVYCVDTGAPGGDTGPVGDPGSSADPSSDEGTTGYTLLEPLPTLAGNTNPDLASYLGGLYILIIGMAGVLAAFMIIIGGIEFIFAAVPSAKSDAKDRIGGAIGGLLLALTAWILLNTINPELLTKGFNLEDVGKGGAITAPETGGLGTGGGGTAFCGVNFSDETKCFSTEEACNDAIDRQLCHTETGGPDFLEAESAARTSLSDAEISVNKKSCGGANVSTDTVAGGCTNVSGLVESGLMEDILIFDEACDQTVAGDCNMTITGGSEFGHSEGSLHNTGDAVDFRTTADINEFMESGSCTTTVGFGVKKCTKGGLTCNLETNPDHWHCR